MMLGKLNCFFFAVSLFWPRMRKKVGKRKKFEYIIFMGLLTLNV